VRILCRDRSHGVDLPRPWADPAAAVAVLSLGWEVGGGGATVDRRWCGEAVGALPRTRVGLEGRPAPKVEEAERRSKTVAVCDRTAADRGRTSGSALSRLEWSKKV
jgi:hypothetical protein